MIDRSAYIANDGTPIGWGAVSRCTTCRPIIDDLMRYVNRSVEQLTTKLSCRLGEAIDRKSGKKTTPLRSPSNKQLSLLKDHGIAAPPNRLSCYRLINYLIIGNETLGRNFSERVRITLRYQKKWIGRRVSLYGRTGKVLWLLPVRTTEVLQLRETHGHKRFHPFKAVFKGDDNKGKVIFLSFLKQED
jgi:hypothetical protein